VLWAGAGFAPIPAAAAGEILRNERVVVVEVRLAPQQEASWKGAHPAANVYFTEGLLEVAGSGGAPTRMSVQRGQAEFVEPGSRTLKNLGPAEARFVHLEFLGAGSDEIWGTSGLSPAYKLLFENRYARVYDIRIPAGGREPQHSHRDRVVICLSGAIMSHLLPDGRQEPSTLKTGEVAWRRGGTHVGQNLGHTDLWVIAVEPK